MWIGLNLPLYVLHELMNSQTRSRGYTWEMALNFFSELLGYSQMDIALTSLSSGGLLRLCHLALHISLNTSFLGDLSHMRISSSRECTHV